MRNLLVVFDEEEDFGTPRLFCKGESHVVVTPQELREQKCICEKLSGF
jgi:hypothetical protein